MDGCNWPIRRNAPPAAGRRELAAATGKSLPPSKGDDGFGWTAPDRRGTIFPAAEAVRGTVDVRWHEFVACSETITMVSGTRGSSDGGTTPFDDLGIAVASGEPLAHHTWLGIGGAARYFCEPIDVDALARVVRRCHERGISLRVIGGGSNILVPSGGYPGMVVRLSAPAFCSVEVRGSSITAGSGAKLVHVVSAAVQAGLGGLEMLVGIPGTVGGAVVGNAGSRGGDVGARVGEVTVMLADGTVDVRRGSSLAFQSRWSNLDDVIVIACRFDLDEESPELLTKRMQKQWIVERSEQPSGTRSVAMMFKDPLGTTAESLIAQAGVRDLRVGQASVYGAHANYAVAAAGCSSEDVRGLVEQVRAVVRDKLGVELAPLIDVW